MMILVPIAVGLYVITMIGYYKLMYRTRELGERQDSPFIVKFLVASLSLVWPVLVLYSLVTEAVKLD